MKYIPHVLVVAVMAAAPVFFAALANGPITSATFGQALITGLGTLVAVLLKSPVAK